jgi:hypothetical protein
MRTEIKGRRRGESNISYARRFPKTDLRRRYLHQELFSRAGRQAGRQAGRAGGQWQVACGR